MPTRSRGHSTWYKDAVFYELRVRSFFDGNGDGVGDFKGLAEKLDYLQDLGVTALWLLPFYPSPLRDDGYDISDYVQISPDCGTLDEFRFFLDEAHRRGLRVVTELVLNHTSNQHPWFQRARRSPPGSRWREYYVWSDTPDRYPEARIIFKDFETSNWTWDPVAKAYYWHRFYSHQPDLNFESSDVRRAVFRAMDFWFDLGVDGMRLDAVPYLYERDGTNCENLPETHAFLKELRRHLDGKYRDRMLLAEANQWPEDAVAYFGAGDECHLAFHFPLMPRLFMALHMEDRYPIVDILAQTPEIPASCQWALFLRNHDELTLEMVTDEERDYMYRVYAHDREARINLGIRRRLAPLLGNDRRRMELMNALLFSLPGTPVLYYGDEIGMGDNVYLGDRNGVRTPMQWSGDRNAGFSRANPQRLYLPVIVDPEYHYESVNVEAQQGNPRSFLWWTKRLIALRKQYPTFSRGGIEFLSPANPKVLAFLRQHEDQILLIVLNLSRFVQFVELDLARHKGRTVVEVFGRNPFPPISDAPYLLTLGPHSFYWFSLERPTPATAPGRAGAKLATLRVRGTWRQALEGQGRTQLERALPAFLAGRRWFGGKGRTLRKAAVSETVAVSQETALVLVRCEYVQGDSETYALPLKFERARNASGSRDRAPEGGIVRIEVEEEAGLATGWLIDAPGQAPFASALLQAIAERRTLQGESGRFVASASRAFVRGRGSEEPPPRPVLLRSEQSNSSVLFDRMFILKLFRRLPEGINPELEIGRYLTERARFPHAPAVLGALEYQSGQAEPVTVAVLHAFVANEGDAWRLALDEARRFLDRVLGEPAPDDEDRRLSLLDLTERRPPAALTGLISSYLERARLLGRRTAEMHLALASAADEPRFAPEPYTTLYQRSLYQSMRNLTAQVFRLLRERLPHLAGESREAAEEVLPLEDAIRHVFHGLVGRKLSAVRIRCHGDYHLGQVLHTGKDFVIIDFEGEPARPLSERRLKRSPLTDVAGMLRSFDYAAHRVLMESASGGFIRPEDRPRLERWADLWQRWVGSAFLRAYLRHTEKAGLLPRTRPELGLLLQVFLLEKNVYEIGYELNNRPDWLRIPARSIVQLLQRGN